MKPLIILAVLGLTVPMLRAIDPPPWSPLSPEYQKIQTQGNDEERDTMRKTTMTLRQVRLAHNLGMSYDDIVRNNTPGKPGDPIPKSSGKPHRLQYHWIYYTEFRRLALQDQNGEIHYFRSDLARYDQRTQTLQRQLDNGRWIQIQP